MDKPTIIMLALFAVMFAVMGTAIYMTFKTCDDCLKQSCPTGMSPVFISGQDCVCVVKATKK